MQPLLAPGVHVLRRGPHEVQVGLDPASAVVLPSADALPDALPGLVRAGLALADDRGLRSALPPHDGDDPWPRHAAAALARRHGAALPDACDSREHHVVAVTATGHRLAGPLADELTELCRRSGLRLRSRSRPGPLPRGARRPSPVHVLVAVGEPRRELLDDWVRRQGPHLVVRLVEGRAAVGPFVVPGSTACLRCLDAYRTEQDPVWPLLVEQHSRASRADRPDGVPEPVDAALAAVAVGWAARDLACYVEGGTPASWSSTLTFDARLDAVEPLRWPAHPHCGCGWG
jgi:bacteriocin biosynthesis cyclodehydratase domain-containing protein